MEEEPNGTKWFRAGFGGGAAGIGGEGQWANIVKAPEADREYILTQGALEIYMEDELTICVSQGL